MRTEISAGGIVYKKQGNTVVWLIAKHSGYHKWGFPKGLVEISVSDRFPYLHIP